MAGDVCGFRAGGFPLVVAVVCLFAVCFGYSLPFVGFLTLIEVMRWVDRPTRSLRTMGLGMLTIGLVASMVLGTDGGTVSWDCYGVIDVLSVVIICAGVSWHWWSLVFLLDASCW